jgi:citrate lyase subunit beta/citryl-CoA lyase
MSSSMHVPLWRHTILRSALFVPADAPEKHDRAFDSDADAVIVDLEDAVAPASKDGARAMMIESLATKRPSASVALVRVNSPLTPQGQADIEALTHTRVEGIVVPKADPEAIAQAAFAGLPLVAMIETAAGVLRAAEIAADPSVAALALGTVDLCAELGIRDSLDGDELIAARSQVVLAAAAAGKQGPLDGPCMSLGDERALELETARARRLGFAGKTCIHPAQVAPVMRAFSATAQELEWARRVLDAFGDGSEGGLLVLDGQLVDEPVLRRARRVLDGERPS